MTSLTTLRDATTAERLALTLTSHPCSTCGAKGATKLRPHRDAVAVRWVRLRVRDRAFVGYLLMDLAGCVVFITGDHHRTLPPHAPGANDLRALQKSHQ